MADSGISYHNAYRFETWGAGKPVKGFVYKRQPQPGWVATVDGTDIQVLLPMRTEAADEAVRRARADD